MFDNELLSFILAAEVRRLALQMMQEDLAAYSDEFDIRHPRTGPNGEIWKPDAQVKAVALREWKAREEHQLDAYLIRAFGELQRVVKLFPKT